MAPVHPQLQLWLDIGGLLADAAEAGARRVQSAIRRPRSAVGQSRRPGPDTPMWNACVDELRSALQLRGAKARLARYLGIPKQRVTDFVRGRRRLPDAELALRLLHWLAEQRAGRDPSL